MKSFRVRSVKPKLDTNKSSWNLGVAHRLLLTRLCMTWSCNIIRWHPSMTIWFATWKPNMSMPIRDLQIRRATEIKDLRQSHEQKIDEVLEGYAKMSKEFEAIKVERDSLREALGIEPELERQECCVRAPPYTSVCVNEPQTSQECCVRAPNTGVVSDEPQSLGICFCALKLLKPQSWKCRIHPMRMMRWLRHCRNRFNASAMTWKAVPRRKVKNKYSSSSDSDSQSSNHDEYKQESKLMRTKALWQVKDSFQVLDFGVRQG